MKLRAGDGPRALECSIFRLNRAWTPPWKPWNVPLTLASRRLIRQPPAYSAPGCLLCIFRYFPVDKMQFLSSLDDAKCDYRRVRLVGVDSPQQRQIRKTLVQADNYPRLLATSLSCCLSVCSLSRAFRINRKPLLFRSPRFSPAYSPAPKGKVEAKHAATVGYEIFTAKIGIIQPNTPRIEPQDC